MEMKRQKATNLMAVVIAALVGFFVGILFPICSLSKITFSYGSIFPNNDGEFPHNESCKIGRMYNGNCTSLDEHGNFKIYEKTNPKGAETLPPGFVVSESDFYQRRLWGRPEEDLPNKPKYLVAFTVGYGVMKENVNNAVKKFSDNFTIILFHYDGRINEWDEFEWSKRVIHISARQQTKWWFAKRFMHPDIVSAYEYIFIWDEDLGVDNFNAEEYIKLVKKYELEISQPALGERPPMWRMTERQRGQDIHKIVEDREGWCAAPHLPPCGSFVEIMAPVFSRNAWRCVWHMIQNDLVHGWGLDFSLWRCVEPAHEKIGVVDAQWIVHHAIPTLTDQGQQQNENTSSQAIRKRSRYEWKLFDSRMKDAENNYYRMIGFNPPNSNSTNSTS